MFFLPFIDIFLSVLQEPLSMGHVHTVCVCVELPGCAPHELLCIHPKVLLDKNVDSVPWDKVDDALRSFLLQMHSLQFAMPEAIEGVQAPAPCATDLEYSRFGLRA
jgi:hypothetical protein